MSSQHLHQSQSSLVEQLRPTNPGSLSATTTMTFIAIDLVISLPNSPESTITIFVEEAHIDSARSLLAQGVQIAKCDQDVYLHPSLVELNWNILLAYRSAKVSNIPAAAWFLGRIQDPIPEGILTLFAKIFDYRLQYIPAFKPSGPLLVGERDELIYRLRAQAKDCFASNDYETADDYLQLANALINPFLAPLASLSVIAIYSELRYLISDHQEYVTSASSKGDAIHHHLIALDDSDSKNRTAFSNLVVGLLSSGAKILDVGCYSGALLTAFQHASRNQGKAVSLCGIEPIPQAVQYIANNYPQLHVQQAEIDTLVNGHLDQDIADSVTCITLSAVCQVITPEQFDCLLSWASSRISMLAIADDIVNINGTSAIYRGSIGGGRGIYILHPFRKCLEEHGFAIECCEMAPETNRPYSGFIIATNRRLG